jgi:hypothetical protein
MGPYSVSIERLQMAISNLNLVSDHLDLISDSKAKNAGTWIGSNKDSYLLDLDAAQVAVKTSLTTQVSAAIGIYSAKIVELEALNAAAIAAAGGL